MKSDKVGILGSGFGLYGYLPAFASLGASILLPNRYYEKFAARRDVAKYRRNVDFVEDEERIFEMCDTLVIAKRPADQFSLINTVIPHDNIRAIYLEKPIAPNPAQATTMHDILTASDKTVRVGYIFPYMDFSSLLRQCVNSDLSGKLYIKWHFLAHHFQKNMNTWKRNDSAGGGAIRFYGIQLIAMLAACFDEVDIVTSFGRQASVDETYAWEAHFILENHIDLYASINSKVSENVFFCGFDECKDISSKLSPFGGETNNEDVRVAVLKKIIADTGSVMNHHGMYQKTLVLWEKIEKCTEFMIE